MKEVKTISLSGHLNFDILPLSIVDFSRQEVFIYLTEDQKCLGVLVGENEFLDTNQEQFIPFQDGLCVSIKNETRRIVLYRVGDQLRIDEQKKERKWL